jgi:hypothetical protein
VPTFGRETIRRFSNNTSEMKKLAARNFEDLLQVRTSMYGHDNRLMIGFSVLFQSLTVFSQSHTTVLFYNYYSFVATGMAWQNSVCIQTTHSRFSMIQRTKLVSNFVNSTIQHVLHSTRENSSVKRKHASVVSRRKEQTAQHQPLDLASKRSTCRHTNYIL